MLFWSCRSDSYHSPVANFRDTIPLKKKHSRLSIYHK